ncbi:unnamed protein product [Clonostachys rosea]|uniref:Uncharacterized protein n=1 Tax=Bionectria ochroleuca TaxID=29856 RepID=A0ABY6U1X5_BIOOC|nr:unnamed protein product [Clonostachys rosea]
MWGSAANSDERMALHLGEVSLQDHLLQVIKEGDASALSEFLSHNFPQLAPDVRDEYTAPSTLASPLSLPSRLLVAAVEAEAPFIFKIIWDSFYAPHFVDQPGPPSNSHEQPGTDNRVQIPWECLKLSAIKGSITLASVFIKSLARAPPFSVHPAGRLGSLIVTALQHRRFEYVDHMLAHGVDINHEWPRVRVLQTAISFEQDDAEAEFMLFWLLKRGARIQGTGALRLMVQYGLIEGARALLDSGADVEDVEEITLPLPGRRLPEVENDSALMEAVKGGGLPMVRLLLERGAQVGWQNARGDTPTSLAETKGLHEILVLLKGHETTGIV